MKLSPANLLLIIGAALSLGGVVFLVARQMDEYGFDLSVHGIAALALGAVFTLGLSAALFYLAFRSARTGFDDHHGPDDPTSRGD